MITKQFRINRVGRILIKDKSSNQCKIEGHGEYKYAVRATCLTSLDDDDFIIDHTEIDDAVQHSMRKAHSCERMCIKIAEAVQKRMQEHGVILVKLYVRIIPVSPETKAFMEYEINY